jgi:cytochrome c-type biogenesis protein CcmE
MNNGTIPTPLRKTKSKNRTKFYVGGLLIIAAVIYLIVSSTQANAQYFVTVDELKSKGASVTDHELRISGAVIGSTISYDAKNLTLKFTIANVPGSNQEVEAQGGLAKVLHMSVVNPNSSRLVVVYKGVKPDLLKDEAQAILTGKLGSDGVFYATELLLKCPTKYQEAVPTQATN